MVRFSLFVLLEIRLNSLAVQILICFLDPLTQTHSSKEWMNAVALAVGILAEHTERNLILE